jgi:Rad3-related DNA helicase
MSATVISGQEMVRELGWDRGGYRVVNVKATFPAKNRRVKIEPAGDMSRQGAKRDKGVVIGRILKILYEYPNDRILIHTVSYDLSRDIADACRYGGRNVYSYTESNQRATTLAGYVNDPTGVLVAPSFDRGIDLPGDLCRVQVIAKVPFPYLGDKQVSARLHSKNGQLWYNIQTIRSIVQMCGRGVRSSEDWCVTYILDSQFRRFWEKCRGLFPNWWKEALDWERV